MRLAGDDLREAGVGLDAEEARAGAGEVADVLAHLLRAGGAVQADDIDFGVGFESRDGGGDVGADEHGAGGLDGDLAQERDTAAAGVEGEAGGLDRDLGLEDVQAGLDQEDVNAAVEEAAGLLEVAGEEVVVADLAEGDQLGAGAERADGEAWVVRGGDRVHGVAGEAGGGDVEVVGSVGEAEFGEDDAIGAEGVGLDGVTADVEEAAVNLLDGVGAGLDEDFGAILEAAIVSQRQVERMLP